MSLTRKKMFERNLALTRDMLLEIIQHPEKADDIPDGARVVALPRDDPELLKANLKLVAKLAHDGDPRPIVLIPENGRQGSSEHVV
jgi:hypothetical protein